MQVIKKGLIYCPENLGGWRDNSFMTPFPYLISENVIRVFGGFRDSEGASRFGYVDVDANDPKKVLAVSEKPIIELGEDGTFDDNGMLLGCFVPFNNELRMYYVGFQLVKKAKFYAFSGLAISKDNGNTFERYQSSPVLDRYKREKFIRGIHSVIYEDNKFRVWYAAGLRWQYINGIPYPQYQIRYIESKDGIVFPVEEGIDCLVPINDEYRIGKPVIFKEDNKYKMFYTTDTLSKVYSCGYAESDDGINWVRRNDLFQLPMSETGWDSESCCYPVPITVKDKTYIFYSGNGMGKTGFGYAEIIK